MNTALVIVPGNGPPPPPVTRQGGPRLLPPLRPVEPVNDAPWRGQHDTQRNAPLARQTASARDDLPPRQGKPEPNRATDPIERSFARPSGAPSSLFAVQLLAQQGDSSGQSPLSAHRDGPELVSAAYRKSGGEPALYSPDATLFRFAV